MRMINVIRKTHSTQIFLRKYGFETARILNAGSSDMDFGNNCINVDIQKKRNINCVCDVHSLPFKDSTFDIVILTAVLQYCRNPYGVASELHRCLKTNGLLYVDAPFVQPYCFDTPDLFRFTKDGLLQIFRNDFVVEECNTSIPGGSSLAFYIQSLVDILGNRYLNYALRCFVSLIVLPLSFLNFGQKSDVAGAFYLICRKMDMTREDGLTKLIAKT